MSYTLQEILPYYKRNLKVAFPVMLTQLGAAMVGLADSIMVGHYGTADLAAVSFSNAVFFTVMVFSMGALMGITPLVGQVHGKLEKLLAGAQNPLSHPEREEIAHRHEQITSYLANGLVFMTLTCLLSLLLLAPCIFFLDAFGQEPDVTACARPYYILIVLSIVPFLLFCFCKQFLEGLGNTTAAMLITLGCNLLNILLNWVFIYGHWGFSTMGAEGAGWATLIARTLMPLCFFLVMFVRSDWRCYLTGLRRRMVTRREVESILAVGAPIGLQSFAEAFLFTASFVIIGWIGKEALAAHHIANQMADLTFLLAQGIGAATTIRVSHQLGKGDLHAVRMASRASVHLCLLMNTIGAAIMILGRNCIPYNGRPEGGSHRLLAAGHSRYVPVRRRTAMYRGGDATGHSGRAGAYAYRPLLLYRGRPAPRSLAHFPCRTGRQRNVDCVRNRTRYSCRPLPYTIQQTI